MSGFWSWDNWFMWIGAGLAVFYGLRAVPIFLKPTKSDQEALKRYEEYKTWRRWDWWIYQFVFNASGELIGWIALWALWKKQSFGVEDFLLLIVAFLGVAGYLPTVASRWQLKQ